MLEMYTRGLELHNRPGEGARHDPTVLERVAAGDLHPERVTSSMAAWDQAPEAVSEAQTKLVIER